MPNVVANFFADDLCSQMCLLPINLLESSGISPGDVVSIQDGPCNYLNYIFVKPPTVPEKNITISDVVFVKDNFESRSRPLNDICLPFPEAFKVEKPVRFENITVEIVFRKMFFNLNYKTYERLVGSLLQGLVFCKGAVVNCSSFDVAKMFSITEIKIRETHSPGNVCGRISKASKITIDKHSFPEEANIRRGVSEMANIHNMKKLQDYVLYDKRIMITGPSGCGKSVLAKKFCLDFDYHFILIDCLKTSDLSVEKCEEHFRFLISSSFKYKSILLIDHIDQLSQDPKLKPFPVAMLVHLIHRLDKSNVCVLATAVQMSRVHPAIADFFEEVSIGVPSVEQRKKILEASLNLSDSAVDVDRIARNLQSFVASDIVQLSENVVRSKTGNLCCKESIKDLRTQDFEDALLNFTPSLLRGSAWNMKVKPVHWDEIGGMRRIKKKLQLCVEKPLLQPEIFEDVGLNCPNGVLLFGPPGCCKTTLARGLATECKANFFAANPSQIYSAYVGESEKNISELFYQARLCPPSIIFLDELDSLVGSRDIGSKQQGVAEKVLSTLLNEMDGCSIKGSVGGDDLKLPSEEEAGVEKSKKNQVIVVGATNRPDCIDSALLRPGRFDMILYVPPPNYEERISILETITKGMPLMDVDFNEVAKKTEFFTGADLKNLANMAAMNAFREDKINAKYVRQDHFTQALQCTKPSITREQINLYEQLSVKYGLVVSDKDFDKY